MMLAEQLALFADLPLPIPAAPPAPPLAAPAAAPPAGAFVATRPPATLPEALRWREVEAPQQTIGYVLRRSSRKSIGLSINDDGLLVTAPKWVTLRQIDDVVVEKAGWVLDKLRKLHERQRQLAMADTQWRAEGRIPYLGRQVVLSLDDARQAPTFLGAADAPADGDRLVLPLPLDAAAQRVRDSAHAWLQRQAQDWLGRRLAHFVSLSPGRLRRWRLSSAATRWGSCNSDGNIMLNWRLIHFEPAVIDYVVAHEVAHLRELNHSDAFWREVGRLLPGFESARDVLRRHDPASLPLL